MPPFDLLSQHFVDQPLLLQHTQPPKLLAHNINPVHAPTPSRDIRHLQLRAFQLRHEHLPYLPLFLIEMRRRCEGGGCVGSFLLYAGFAFADGALDAGFGGTGAGAVASGNA